MLKAATFRLLRALTRLRRRCEVVLARRCYTCGVKRLKKRVLEVKDRPDWPLGLSERELHVGRARWGWLHGHVLRHDARRALCPEHRGATAYWVRWGREWLRCGREMLR